MNLSSDVDPARLYWCGKYCHLPDPLRMSAGPALQYVYVTDSLRPRGPWLARFLCPWDSPGKNTGVGCHALSRGYSLPRDRTQVSCTADRFFTIWATREAPALQTKCQTLLVPMWATQPQSRGAQDPRPMAAFSSGSRKELLSWSEYRDN